MFTPTEDGRGRYRAGYTVDGTHPTDAGHAAMFGAIPLTLFARG